MGGLYVNSSAPRSGRQIPVAFRWFRSSCFCRKGNSFLHKMLRVVLLVSVVLVARGDVPAVVDQGDPGKSFRYIDRDPQALFDWHSPNGIFPCTGTFQWKKLSTTWNKSKCKAVNTLIWPKAVSHPRKIYSECILQRQIRQSFLCLDFLRPFRCTVWRLCARLVPGAIV